MQDAYDLHLCLPRTPHAGTEGWFTLCPRDVLRPQLACDMTGWYKRWENNGWRPIADRIFVEPELAAKQQKAEAQQHWFHYCPKVRRQEREAAAKQRKRLWMANIYRWFHQDCT